MTSLQQDPDLLQISSQLTWLTCTPTFAGTGRDRWALSVDGTRRLLLGAVGERTVTKGSWFGRSITALVLMQELGWCFREGLLHRLFWVQEQASFFFCFPVLLAVPRGLILVPHASLLVG